MKNKKKQPTSRKGQPAPNKGKKYPPRKITKEEMRQLYGAFTKAPTSVRNKALIGVLHRCGPRLFEALSMRPEDVNLVTRVGFLPKTKGRPRTENEMDQNEPIKRTPRYFGIPQDCADMLGDWMRVRHDLGINGKSPLFCTLRGGNINPNYARIFLPRLAGRVGIKGRVNPHSLRHTFAAEFYEDTRCLATTCAALGHVCIKYTLDYLKTLGMIPKNVIEIMKRR